MFCKGFGWKPFLDSVFCYIFYRYGDVGGLSGVWCTLFYNDA